MRVAPGTFTHKPIVDVLLLLSMISMGHGLSTGMRKYFIRPFIVVFMLWAWYVWLNGIMTDKFCRRCWLRIRIRLLFVSFLRKFPNGTVDGVQLEKVCQMCVVPESRQSIWRHYCDRHHRSQRRWKAHLYWLYTPTHHHHHTNKTWNERATKNRKF